MADFDVRVRGPVYCVLTVLCAAQTLIRTEKFCRLNSEPIILQECSHF
jgi:hypothetical protein